MVKFHSKPYALCDMQNLCEQLWEGVNSDALLEWCIINICIMSKCTIISIAVGPIWSHSVSFTVTTAGHIIPFPSIYPVGKLLTRALCLPFFTSVCPEVAHGLQQAIRHHWLPMNFYPHVPEVSILPLIYIVPPLNSLMTPELAQL